MKRVDILDTLQGHELHDTILHDVISGDLSAEGVGADLIPGILKEPVVGELPRPGLDDGSETPPWLPTRRSWGSDQLQPSSR